MDNQPSPAPAAPELPPTPEEKQREHVDYLKNIVRPKPAKKRWPKWSLLVVVVIIIVSVGVVLAMHHSPAKPAKSSTSNAPKVTPTQTTTSTTTAHYISNGKDLNLDFDYPSNWTVTPTSNNNPNDQPISVTSPLVSISSAAGQSVTGKVVLMIRPGSATMSELTSMTSAAQNSVQIAYSKPVSGQHAYPYLTFVHMTDSPAASFQEIVVTGINTFSANDALTSNSFSVDPIISASFYSCSSTTCTGSSAVPLAITNSTWTNASIFQQTLTTIESLQLN